MVFKMMRNRVCEGGGDVVGVVTLLVGEVAQAFHDDRVFELRVQLGVEEVEGKDREEQVEVEKVKRFKEGAPWMTMKMVVTRLRSWANEVWDDITRCERVRAMCELSAWCAPRKRLCERRHWCTCCALWAACNCACSRHSTLWWCCSWSHTWSHRSCCNCRFRRSHFTLCFSVWEIYSLQRRRLALRPSLVALSFIFFVF